MVIMKRLRVPLIIFALCCVFLFMALTLLFSPQPDPLYKLFHDLQSLDNLPHRLRSKDDRTFAFAAIYQQSRHLNSEHAEAIIDFMSSGISGDEHSAQFCQIVKQRSALFEPVIVATLMGRHRPPDGLHSVGTAILMQALRGVDARYPSNPELLNSVDGINKFQAIYEQRQRELQKEGPKN